MAKIIGFIIGGIVLLIALLIDHINNGGLTQGDHSVFINKNPKIADAPLPKMHFSEIYEYRVRYGILIFMATISFIMIGIDLIFTEKDIPIYARSVPFYTGIGTLIFTLVFLRNRIQKKLDYPHGIFKIGKDGIWTKKLGCIMWDSISRIKVNVNFEGFGRKTEVYYLQIETLDKLFDEINLIDIKTNRNRLLKKIKNYAQHHI